MTEQPISSPVAAASTTTLLRALAGVIHAARDVPPMRYALLNAARDHMNNTLHGPWNQAIAFGADRDTREAVRQAKSAVFAAQRSGERGEDSTELLELAETLLTTRAEELSAVEFTRDALVRFAGELGE